MRMMDGSHRGSRGGRRRGSSYTPRYRQVSKIPSVDLPESEVIVHAFPKESVKDECARFMGRRIRIENAIDLLRIGSQIGGDKMKKIAVRFIDKNFVSMSLTDSFAGLTVEELEMILKRDSLYIESENEVFGALDRWKRYHPDANGAKLLKLVRCTRLSPSLLNEIVDQTQWIKESPECIELINEAKGYNRNKNQPCSFKTRERIFEEAHRLIACMETVTHDCDEENDEGVLHIYDPIADEWTDSQTPKLPNWNRTVAVIGRKVYFIGGFPGNDDSTDIPDKYPVFDWQTNEWAEELPMQSARKKPVVGVIDGIMKRSRSASCVLDGKLYVLGGCVGDQYWYDGECYDPETDGWTLIAPLNTARNRFGVASFHGHIYAVGGTTRRGQEQYNEQCSDVERYDPATDSWTTLNRMPMEGSVELVVCCSRLFAVKCWWGNGHAITVAMYLPEENTWETDGLPDFEMSLNVFSLPAPISASTNFEDGYFLD